MVYNVRTKTFPGGMIQVSFYQRYKFDDYTIDDDANEKDDDKEPDVERSKLVACTRAKQEVYDIARANTFDYFLTGTFDPKIVLSTDYDQVTKHLVFFTRRLRDRGVQYVLVLEQHKSGAWHFHGLLYDPLKCLALTPAKSPYTGKLIVDEQGRQVYNCPIYDFGFTTVTHIGDRDKACGYLCKYLTKDMAVPKGKKRYWASRGLQRPTVDKYMCDQDTYADIFNASDFSKSTTDPEGNIILFCEYHGGEDGADARVNKIKTILTQQNKNLAGG